MSILTPVALTDRNFGKLIDCSPSTVKRLRAEGKIESRKVRGRWLTPISEAHRLLNFNLTTPDNSTLTRPYKTTTN